MSYSSDAFLESISFGEKIELGKENKKPETTGVYLGTNINENEDENYICLLKITRRSPVFTVEVLCSLGLNHLFCTGGLKYNCSFTDYTRKDFIWGPKLWEV